MDGKVVIGCDLDTRSFDSQIEYVESQMNEIEDKLKQADMGFEVGDTQKLEADYERLGNKLDNLRKKQTKLNQEQAQMGKLDLSGVQDGINNVNKGLQGTIKKVAKWGLALFGIRTAYNAIRGAMSTLSQYDTQMANNIEYIRYSLAYTLQPVIQTILNLVIKLLQYINYIAKAWTGKNLFKTADAFKSAQKSASGVAKSAKEINKQLSGFDEINVLSDTSSSGAGGTGGADIKAPNIDLTGMQGEVPSWIQWIADNKDIVIAGLLGIAGGLVAINLGLKPIQALGIGVALAGIIFAIQNLIKFLQDPTFENFTNIIIGIGIAILGVGIIIGNFPLIIAGVIIAIVGLIIKNYDFIIGLFDSLIKWFENDFINALVYFLGPLGYKIAAPFIFAINYIKGAFEGFYGGIKKIVTGIVQLFKGDFTNGLKNVFGGLKSILLAPINSLISGINSLIRGINKISFDVPDWVPLLGGKKWGFNIPQIPKLAVGGIVNMPGRGVPVGGAIAGEAGREGVIPLTDSQQMALLGEAIGKYVRIDNIIDVNMDSRRINRILQSSSDRVNFASNR